MILLFPSERPLFVREYANGTYSAFAYFWSKLVMELPLSLITALITFLVCYWLEALQVPSALNPPPPTLNPKREILQPKP